jgi:hypothetical protein
MLMAISCKRKRASRMLWHVHRIKRGIVPLLEKPAWRKDQTSIGVSHT